jgi:hypothetical protein
LTWTCSPSRRTLPSSTEITTRLARTLHLELVAVAAVGRRIEQEQPANLNARD